MTEHPDAQKKNIMKNLQKKEQGLLARLRVAQRAQAKAFERYRRAEERLQKRMARVQNIEGQLALARQQIDDIQVHPETPSVEIEIPAWAQYTPPPSNKQDPSGNTLESADYTREARSAAKVTEENIRTAAERASAVHEKSDVDLETAEVAEIEAEEEFVESFTAVTIAEIAAERAAAAEALAEASSARTREVRKQAQMADEALGEIRVAIRNDLLTGEEAEHALREAELEITRTQAALADAEAAEEQAIKAAMNAEAEAEVAEGMAYATVDRSDSLVEEGQEISENELDNIHYNPHSQAQEME